MNVVLIGFMGTGKSSIGKLLSAKLGYKFVDSDQQIEYDLKMSISDIFAKHGENYFRQAEHKIIKKISQYNKAVISTGGGVVLNKDNMVELRKKGMVISLSASIDTILERTNRRNNRPLLEQEDRKAAITELLAKRAAFYADADLVVDTGKYNPQEVVHIILNFLKEKGAVYAKSKG